MSHDFPLAAAIAAALTLLTMPSGGTQSPAETRAPKPQGVRETVEFEGGRYAVTVDTTGAPELTGWVREVIVPMVREWYPKMVELLPSKGYEAPARFVIVFDPQMRGVAATGGTEIRCAAGWMAQNIRGEAPGAVFHEMVHVVQQYGRGRRLRGYVPPPGWLTEGITDYLRWFIYEPQSRGAEIGRNMLARARYDGSYRITGNFLNWVSGKHGADFVPKLNALIREGRYREESWKELTGRTVQELGDEWKADLERGLRAGEAARAVAEKLGRIVIPVIEFERTTLEEAFDFLRARSVELDPEPDSTKKGVSFLIKAPKRASGERASAPPTITYSARDVSLLRALEEVARRAGLDLHLTEVGFVICQPGDPPFPNGKAEQGEVWKTLHRAAGEPGATGKGGPVRGR